jgi:hypothetical protein
LGEIARGFPGVLQDDQTNGDANPAAAATRIKCRRDQSFRRERPVPALAVDKGVDLLMVSA